MTDKTCPFCGSPKAGSYDNDKHSIYYDCGTSRWGAGVTASRKCLNRQIAALEEAVREGELMIKEIAANNPPLGGLLVTYTYKDMKQAEAWLNLPVVKRARGE